MDYTGGALDLVYNVYVLGDQTNSYESELTQLLHVKDCEILSSFLEKVHHALRIEISRLPISERNLFPQFTSIIDLVVRKLEYSSNPALELALLCLSQLARFIKYYGDGARSFPAPREATVLGLCTGSISAAAISASSSLFELIPIGVEAVLVAFRVGLRSIKVRNDIEHGSRSPIWSMIVGMEQDRARTELDALSAMRGYPSASKPYLSAITPTTVTISGPPRSLDELTGVPSFASLKPVSLPVHAPYHAKHLYTASDVDAIIQASDTRITGLPVKGMPMISCSTGRLISASDFGSLIKIVVQDILIEQLRWDNVLNEIKSTIPEIDTLSRYAVLPIHNSLSMSQSFTSFIRKVHKIDASTSNDMMETVSRVNQTRQSCKASESKIAIVGFSGRYPNAESNQKFWELLHDGKDVHRRIPADRFDVEAHYDPSGKRKNTSKVQHGCFIDEPGLFDARFFNMSPREAANTDPGQRLAITTAYEALEMAGFVPNRTPSSQRNRVGCFYGMTSDDWREVNSGQDVDTYFIPGGNRAFTPGRINYHFKFSGPSYSVDTACSSSFAAIHTACNSLWRGDCDTAVAGGTNVLTNPDNFAGLDRGHFLSTTGNCNTFDDDANGYCRADAVGTVILKRLEDAEADGDPIFGVLLGAFTNHSAEADSITRPLAAAQSYIFDKMLNSSNVDPLDVSYIEMHGTGTQAGDATEMQSVVDTFAKAPRGHRHPLHLGSVKANVGHAESASGVTALIKVLLMMKNNEIPPHCGIKTKINHNFPKDLEARNVNIALKPARWERPESQKRSVFMNNFSAAGGNTALLMEDAPRTDFARAQDRRSTHLVAVSAKTVDSLQRNVEALRAVINKSTSLPDLSYTTTARRMHHNFRAIVSGHDLPSIQQGLQDLGACANIKRIPAKPPNVAFVFTGQGSTYCGMVRDLFETSSSFRSDIQRFDGIARKQGFPSFLPIIDCSNNNDFKELSPVITQVGVACTQMALARLWISWGVAPSTVIGHSLGEYAALNAAGVLSVSDTIYLTGVRARLLEQRCTAGTHSMLAVKSPLSLVTPHLVESTCEIACINGANETVVSGKNADVDGLSSLLTALEIRCVKLEIPFAFHSAQVEPILEDFESLAKGVAFDKPAIPFISPLLQGVVSASDILNPSYLRQACRKPVNFLGGIDSAIAAGIVGEKTLWVEIGAHPACSGMLKSMLGSQIIALPSQRRNTESWKTLAESTASLHQAGLDINWNEYHRDFPSKVLELPSYSWDNKNHWIQYENNFCLTKGDKPAEVVQTAAPEVSSLSTTSVQRVVEQSLGDEKSTLIIESDLSDPNLRGVVEGHVVNGANLCPSSLYADVALTVSDYLSKCHDTGAGNAGMAVSDMVVAKPLIATGKGAQLFRASASADWRSKRVKIQIYSVTSDGKKTMDHANCTVKYESKDEWLKEWQRSAYLIRSRMDTLHHTVDDGQSNKMKRGMAYKLFGALVLYGKSYQGMQEVVLDSAQLEATARVQFQTTESDGQFFFSPYWIDSLGHLAGFVMNANDGVDSKSTVFVNHGWESMRCSVSFSKDKTYQTYVKMQNVGGTMHAGDVYIFHEGDVQAVYQGVKFQGVPRRALDHLLPAASSSKPAAANAQAAVARAIPAPTGTITKDKVRTTTEKTPGSTVEKVKTVRETIQAVSTGSDMAHQGLAIVAEEIGLSVVELVPSSDFSDLGVDSLLTLTITSRLREELDMEVPASLFVDYPTVKELTTFLRGNDANGVLSVQSTSGGLTPETESEASGYQTETDDTEMSSADEDDIDVMALIRYVLAEEIGLQVNELKDTSDFGELGLDSLLSLTVLARLREELDMDLPASLLADNNSLNEVKAALGIKQKSTIVIEETRCPLNKGVSKSVVTSVKEVLPPATCQTIKPAACTVPKATSMVLQGSSKHATKVLFLFPDGSGSATSYAPLPPISSDVVVFGLNCPYMMSPQDMKCSLEDLTPSYVAEIRRRQPHGPYHLGGWSAGGICAFDAAQEFQRQGEEVAKLILIDSPFPIGLEKLPPRLYDFFSSIGMFGSDQGKAAPAWLVPHFLAFVDSLDKYRAKAFAPGTGPKTHIVWAKDGVCKNAADPRPEPRADDPREMLWLLNNRVDFGPNGWDDLLGGGDKVVVETLENANHFTLMQGQKAFELARFVERAML